MVGYGGRTKLTVESEQEVDGAGKLRLLRVPGRAKKGFFKRRPQMNCPISEFLRENIPILLDRYDLSYCKGKDCIEYFVIDKHTHEQISYDVILCLDRPAKRLIVRRFCPELYKQVECHYLSAACFYILIHHFAHEYHLPKDYCVCLETRREVYKNFFSLLSDFHLEVKKVKFGKSVEVCGDYPDIDIDTTMFKKAQLEAQDLPFSV